MGVEGVERDVAMRKRCKCNWKGIKKTNEDAKIKTRKNLLNYKVVVFFYFLRR